jgi:hypothetical protein
VAAVFFSALAIRRQTLARTYCHQKLYVIDFSGRGGVIRTRDPLVQDQNDPQVQQQQQQAQAREAQQQQLMDAMAQAQLGEAQGKAQAAQAGAMKTMAEAQGMAQGQQQGGLSPQDAMLMQHSQAQAETQTREGQLKNALLEATLHERQSRAVKADLDVQGASLKNRITLARIQGQQTGYPSNL